MCAAMVRYVFYWRLWGAAVPQPFDFSNSSSAAASFSRLLRDYHVGSITRMLS
jgi:hypothetical protein